ncbi:MAG TPA: ATP-binding protein [Polyangiaceae bacterium]|nr:ATP-binding protein [Polyangiaceae bacterium]
MTRALRAYGLAAACVVLSSLGAQVVQPYGHLADLAMIHLLGIVLLSLRSSARTSVIASVISIFSFDFFFISPRYDLAWSDAESIVTFVTMIVVAGVVSKLSENLRRQEQAARATAARTQALYELNVELSNSGDAQQLAAVTARHLTKLFGGPVSVLLQTPEGMLQPAETARDRALSQSAWLRREFVKDSAPPGTAIWLPVVGAHSALGAIGLRPSVPLEQESDQGFLLSACVNQFATAVERVQLAGAVRRTQLEAEGERLRSSLLSAVSHDLKTPLATMIAAGAALIGRTGEIEPKAADEILRSVVSEGERLSRLIHNLLSVTRLESATVELRRTPESVDDIVLSAVERFNDRPRKSPIVSEIAADLPLISAEPVLLEQVLVNLLENATRYGGSDPAIAVYARATEGSVLVQVEDNGPGIAEHEREKVFEKFYRGEHAPKSDGGVGLGLTICRSIIRAHGGKIGVREGTSGGTLVEFTVPFAAAREQLSREASLDS